MSAARAAFGVWAAAAACAAGAAWARPPSPEALAVLQRHECHRCHVVEGLPAYPTGKSCSGCHLDLGAAAGDAARMEQGRAEFGPVYDRFVRRAGGRYVHLPALTGMGRFRASWLERFLLHPYDLRPNLEESMIRSALTPAEAAALAKGWGAQPDVPSKPPRPEGVARGAQLFDASGCGACHLYGNRSTPVARGLEDTLQPRLRLRALAPNLRHARDRLNRATVLAILTDPKAVNPRSEMPKFQLSKADREALADFVLHGDPGPPASPVLVAPPPYDPKAPVPTWEEVEDGVFRQVCWHCHSNPEFNEDDGGPGNTGGLGFPPAGLSVATFRELMSGSLGPDGTRRSVFRPGETGEPVLLERVRLRYQEHARDFVHPRRDDLESGPATPDASPRGMPLGLPALSPEQFSLLERWVKGGRPAPTRPTADGSPMRVR